MVVCGIIAMTFALYSYNVVSESAREGARYAIVRGSSCHFASACPASAGDIQTYVQNLGFPGINTNNLTATPAWAAYPAGGTCTPRWMQRSGEPGHCDRKLFVPGGHSLCCRIGRLACPALRQW